MGPEGSGAGRFHPHRSDFETAVEEAEFNFLAAREAWHAQRGRPAPTRTRMTGLPRDAPESVKEAERRFLQVRNRWLAEQSQRSRL